MQSRTSYFNKAIFLNTLKRFWPLWLAYFAIWTVMLPVTQTVNWLGKAYQVQRDILDIAQMGGIVIGAVYGVLAAMAVWSFMYNSKTVSGVACLPVKREGVFFSVTLAGILPAIVSNIVVFGLIMLIHWGRGYASAVPYDALAFAIVTMMLIFFYGFATLCAQLTGNLITLPAVYLVLNFTAWVVESLGNYILEIILYGMRFSSMGISRVLSPILGMLDGGGRTHETWSEAYADYVIESVTYDGIGFLIVCCIVGIIMLAGSLLLYRRRRMEAAGDVVAVEVMKPVFKYCMTFGCALCCGFFFYNIIVTNIVYAPLKETLGLLFFMLIGAVLGYFIAEMLIHKSFRVFRGRWKGLIVSLAVICVVTLGLEFDLLGIERKVPDAEDVKGVNVLASDSVNYTERENIDSIIALHKSVIENKKVHEEGTGLGASFCVYYYLNDGSVFERNYWLRYSDVDGYTDAGFADVEALEELQNTEEAVSHRKRLPFVASEENIVGGTYCGVISTDEKLALSDGLTEEDLIIINYFGYDEHYVRTQMSEQERQQLMDEYYAYGPDKYNGYSNYNWEFSAEEMWELYTECIVPDLAERKIGKLWIIEDDDYWNTVCSGRVQIEFWYYPEDVDTHAQEYTSATVEAPRPIDMGTPYADDVRTAYYSFSTTPTVGSRTAKWLEDHGVILHTVGEELDMYGGFQEAGKYD